MTFRARSRRRTSAALVAGLLAGPSAGLVVGSLADLLIDPITGPLVSLLVPRAQATPPRRTFSSTAMTDLEGVREVLLRHVARLEVVVKRKPGDPLDEETRDAYAIALDPKHVAVLCFAVEDAAVVHVEGPTGRAKGRVALYDVERRVAIVEVETPLGKLGLEPATLAPKPTLKVGDDLFALTATGPSAGVVNGVLTYVGEEEEYGGHHRTDLQLSSGMPVFDATARFIGFSRTVAWDRDKMMLVTTEMIREARTATAASAPAPGMDATSKKTRDGKPWWSR